MSPPAPSVLRARGSGSAVRGVLLGVLGLATGAVHAPGQAPVRYELSFPDALHHEAEVRVHFTDLQPGPLELRMSRSSPGRYALHEFAKNVYRFRAVDGAGRSLEVVRPDPHQWTVLDHGGEVVVTYTLFGDRADGTYSGIDETHAHLNAPATFLWPVGLFERPVEVRFQVPPGSGWRVATQLVPTPDPYVFTAPDVHYLLDSPVEVSDFALREWQVGPAGEEQTIRVAMHHAGTEAELEHYVERARAIVAALGDVFGTFPAFDHGSYTFLACYLPWVAGDGMEHRNSTVLSSTASLASNETGLLGTLAHEFFHAWSMERIRAAALEPFDFTRAVMSRELWFGEGFTSYYDDLALVRSGTIDTREFARRMGGAANAVATSPAPAVHTLVEMSMQAPFVDAATSVDPTNQGNTFLSYYTWGSAVALALDLTLRGMDRGVTLDDLMRAMWRRHGDPERPYTLEDIEAALAEVAGDAAFARDFLGRYVDGHEVPDFAPLLARAGVVLRRAAPERPVFARVPLRFDGEGALVTVPTLFGGPLRGAGIDRMDRILSVDGRRIRSEGDLAAALRGKRPGDRVPVQLVSRGTTTTTAVTLAADPTLEAVLVEDAGETPTAAARRLREAWMGGGR